MADSVRHMPAEWAIWLQRPGRWEKSHETAFACIASVIAHYEALHIRYASPKIMAAARAAIRREGGNPDHPGIVWQAITNDNAWMRENASQAVFARYLNVTTGLVSQWERGEKRLRGASLKLPTLVAKNGLGAVV